MSISIEEAIVRFRDGDLVARGVAPLTRANYASDLKQFGRYLTAGLGLTRIDQVRPFHLDGFLATLAQHGLRRSSRRRKVAAVRALFRFLVQRGVLAASPAERLRPPGRDREQRRVLTTREHGRLMLSVRREPRDAAILGLLLQTGIRQSECAAITLADLRLPDQVGRGPDQVGTLRVRGKGRKDRVVGLNGEACRAIRTYLAVRPKVNEERLFLTKFERPLGTRSIRHVVAKYVRAADIPAASAHALRHTFATRRVRKGAALDAVRQALGHESLATTGVYVGLAREAMDKELQQKAL